MRIVLMALLPILAPSLAAAHAFLSTATPPVGGTVDAPKTITLAFTEPVELTLSGFDITDPNGHAVTLGKIDVVSGDHKTLGATAPRLPPGAYRVRWHVVSVDTHRTEGEFGFTVKQ